MIAPTLVVGLGGTGSKIVCRVSNMVTEEQRSHIGFAVFDTDINELREIAEADPHIKTIQTSTKLTVGEYLNIDTHARDSWFPVNGILNSKALTEGAGQVRAISRLALDTAIRAGHMEPLHQAVEELYKLEGDGSDQALRVIIVSSLAGGTGSGLILPVALYLKNYLQTKFQASANITRGFFILPEVFFQVIRGQAERNNLRCNAYAALRELDAFLMKGDQTLSERYEESVKIEFPRVGSTEVEQYQIRPYDFCFLFDAQNTEGKKLNNFNQYLDHAANCIYSQSIGPMNKRSNSSEDNTIRELCAQRGRNRYAGAGSAMLIYPGEDIKEYLALNWAKECVSKQWLVFDHMHIEKAMANAEMRAQGYHVKDIDPAMDYIESINQMAKQKDPFAKAIQEACTIFDESGYRPVGNKWERYVEELMKFVQESTTTGQMDIDSQKEQAEMLVAGLEAENKNIINNVMGSGNNVVDDFQTAYGEMEKYRAMVTRRSEDTARTIAYTIFKMKGSATRDKLGYQMETYMRNEAGEFIHPNAVRYFLYQTLETMKKQRIIVEKENRETEEYFDSFYINFTQDPEVHGGPEKLSELKKFDKTEQQELKDKYYEYINKVDEYRASSVLEEVYSEGIDYITSLSQAFDDFYASFEGRVEKMNRRIASIYKKYEYTAGQTSRYVCASPNCMDHFLADMPYTGSTMTIDQELAENIYNQVRDYARMSEKPTDYFNKLFNEGIIGYFKTILMRQHSAQIDMDIIDALEQEAIFEKGISDRSKVRLYVSKVIAETRGLSHPFIERPLGEQKSPIEACTYSIDLDPKDGSPKSDLIKTELGNYGGNPDDDIAKNMIMFYQAIYGLRANGLSKFAPASKEDGRPEGEYYKAYYELISQIKPKSDKTPVITPHIDKRWHIISCMPDLDEKNQEKQENEIYRAFVMCMLFNLVSFSKVSEGKYLYRLELNGTETEEFVVSNGTPCDLYYEVLDALTINPVVVRSILDYMKNRFIKERNTEGKILLERSRLMECLNKLHSEELRQKNGVDMQLSLFDLAMLLKVSTPSAEFDKTVGKNVMREALRFVYEYLGTIVLGDDLDLVYCRLIRDQFKLFDKNISWYMENYTDNFSDYVDDLIRIGINEVDNKEMENIRIEMEQIKEAGIKRREAEEQARYEAAKKKAAEEDAARVGIGR